MVMASPEYTLPSHREINAAFLSKENHSSLALARLKNWKEAKAEGQRKANFILAQATTRFAGEFASERLVNNIYLESDR